MSATSRSGGFTGRECRRRGVVCLPHSLWGGGRAGHSLGQPLPLDRRVCTWISPSYWARGRGVQPAYSSAWGWGRSLGLIHSAVGGAYLGSGLRAGGVCPGPLSA